MVKHLFSIFTLLFLLASCDEIDNDFVDELSVIKSNEMFTFELKVSSDVTDSNTPVLFDVIISRIDSFQVRHDSQVLGKWQLYTKTQNGVNQNISQYPVDYIFSKDNSYSKTIYNTVDNTQYSVGGAWSLSQANTLSLVEVNTTKTINASFDHPGPLIPLYGLMMWTYSENNISISETYQKSEETIDGVSEPKNYIYFDVSGGEIKATTYDLSKEIELAVHNKKNAQSIITGSFEPGTDFTNGNIVVVISNDIYTTVTLNRKIEVRKTND